ncbi:hypothetical protein [Micromonospora sp. SL4-19]|uniref:hypothetical protein n=1 Tax=Micromonospora sp. SL4-19 TaxID=3399129 RepID=UPI003A4DB1B1
MAEDRAAHPCPEATFARKVDIDSDTNRTTGEIKMFGNDADLLLTIHRNHAAELQADAARDRLARSLPRRHPRGWLSRRQPAARAVDGRR